MTRQELDCTNCGVHVVFDMDFNRNGNHVIVCPECDHKHYRVVKEGRITSIRYDPYIPVYYATQVSSTTGAPLYADTGTSASTISYGTNRWFYRQAWLNSSNTTGC